MESANISLWVVGLLVFMALISINLGIVNLLPIPVLDGGHLAFMAFEAVRGKPLPSSAPRPAETRGDSRAVSLPRVSNVLVDPPVVVVFAAAENLRPESALLLLRLVVVPIRRDNEIGRCGLPGRRGWLG